MIEEFFSSWDLFQHVYLSGVFIAVALSVLGVQVVARDQIFIGAALAEASTLGIALGILIETWLGEFGHGEGPYSLPAGLAVVFSVVAAVLTARPVFGSKSTQEAVTGWLFLAGASVSVLLVSHSPHGMEEVHQILFSSIIGATQADVVIFGSLALGCFLGGAFLRRRLLLLAADPDMAAASGVRTVAWELNLCAILGVAVGLSLHVAGLLYTFGCLILPTLATRNFCRSPTLLFFAAPAVAVICVGTAFVLAHEHDQPPAQVAVAVLCAVVALTAAWARWRR
jgi:ABC-type Mn2+/Zn2+ transport system permease subunit